MAIKPILFRTPMVQAIQDGRKTQTRRIIKDVPDDSFRYDGTSIIEGSTCHFLEYLVDGEPTERYYNLGEAPIEKGDILWVRETFAEMFDTNEKEFRPTAPYTDKGFFYKTEGTLFEAPFFIKGFRWKPSIYMPKAAARIFLEVTNVRAEPLNDITEEDAIAEGIKPGRIGFESYNSKNKFEVNALWSFKNLWQSIHGKDSWDKNPWVWVYEFKQTEKPKGFLD